MYLAKLADNVKSDGSCQDDLKLPGFVEGKSKPQQRNPRHDQRILVTRDICNLLEEQSWDLENVQ
jgi:hypothetical protein